MRGPTAVAVAVSVGILLAGCAGTPEDEGDGTTPAVDPWRVVAEARASPEDVSASEVSVAADPTDPDHFVGAANSQGGFGVYVTRDGGASWQAQIYPAERVAPPPGGPGRFVGLSDPVVAFDAKGNVYLAGLAIIPTSSVWVATSTDGGTTWSDGVIVHESDLAVSFNDKEWLAVHPETGTLIVTWQKEPALDSLRGVEAQTGADVDIGDIVVSRSTDQGASWTLAEKVSRGFHNNGTQVTFTPDGNAHMLWLNYETRTLDYVVSEDDGVSWTDPVPVADVQWVPPFDRYSRMHTLPAFVASPVGPELYAVWHDDRNEDPDVLVVASPDGGATWTDVVRVNQDESGNGAIQLYPWAAVDHDGRLHVGYYDARVDPQHPRFHYWHTVADGPTLQFDQGRPFSQVDFTVFSNPANETESHTFGDYTGLAASPNGVMGMWADGRHEQTSVYGALIAPTNPA